MHIQEPNQIKLYADKKGHLVEVFGELADPVIFFSQGGGFQQRMPLKSFQRTFEPAQLPGFKQVRVSGDWMPDDTSLEAYSTGQRWNGWAMPYFTLENGKRVMEFIPDLRYVEQEDAFFWHLEGTDSEDDERYGPTTITVDGVQVKTYALGAGSWCWDQD